MNRPCDCCAGVTVVTPLALANQPALARIPYRIGTHAAFLESMQARLATHAELDGLTTRAADDPSMAVMDAWALVGDVLTFYQERIANEGYLRTATERFSIVELARLIGYTPRPGVASSVYLAYALEDGAAPTDVPAGSKVSSVPRPGETAQTFETGEALAARVEWNELLPRGGRPHPAPAASDAKFDLYVEGTDVTLEPNDPLLIHDPSGNDDELWWVVTVTPDAVHNRTQIHLRRHVTPASDAAKPAVTGMPAALPPAAIDTGAGDAVTAIIALLANYRAIDTFEVSPTAAMTKRVLATLDGIETAASGGPHALAQHLDEQALPTLQEEQQTAHAAGYAKLTPWVDALIVDLQAARPRLDTPPGATHPTLAAFATDTGSGDGSSEALAGPTSASSNVQTNLADLTQALLVKPTALPPRNAKYLPRDAGTALGGGADALPRLLVGIEPQLRRDLWTAWKAPAQQDSALTAYSLEFHAAPFGHNAPLRVKTIDLEQGPTFTEWLINRPFGGPDGTHDVPPAGTIALATTDPDVPTQFHSRTDLYLDNEYPLGPDSRVVIVDDARKQTIVATPKRVAQGSLAAYGMSGKSTLITLPQGKEWLRDEDTTLTAARTTAVYAGNSELTLAEAPADALVKGSTIELDDIYDGLDPGRWLIVAGERADLDGVEDAELVMLGSVEQPTPGSGGTTTLTVLPALLHPYKRDTVRIYGNVVKATHGETRQEVLGSGDATKAFQAFILKQPPLTYVSAPTASGAASTLTVRVNTVRWHEAESVTDLAPGDHAYTTHVGDDDEVSVLFGDGLRGARLPTGQENLTAQYRSGIGKSGNVDAGQISLLSTRPLGVKGVLNPLPASGGADRDDGDRARALAPLAILALDRLVSLSDYAAFARMFAGVGKASAARVPLGRQQVVYVTIAGVDDEPIEPISDLFRNLREALNELGDSHLPISLGIRERLTLVIGAGVRIDPDYSWDDVQPAIQGALVARFGFDAVELGQDLFSADAVSAIQSVPGVVYCDVTAFDALSADDLLKFFASPDPVTLRADPRLRAQPSTPLQAVPARLICLPPDATSTLFLQEITT